MHGAAGLSWAAPEVIWERLSALINANQEGLAAPRECTWGREAECRGRVLTRRGWRWRPLLRFSGLALVLGWAVMELSGSGKVGGCGVGLAASTADQT